MSRVRSRVAWNVRRLLWELLDATVDLKGLVKALAFVTLVVCGAFAIVGVSGSLCGPFDDQLKDTCCSDASR